MASFEERKTEDGIKSYRVKIRLKGHPVETATFERLTDARKWAQSTESAIREGRHFKTTEAKRHTVTQMIDRYIRDVLSQKPKSIHDRKTQLNWWKDQIGSYSLADATPALIAEARDRLAQGKTLRAEHRSAGTVNRYLAALSHAFTIAIREWGWLQDNPLRRVTKPKENRGRVRFLSDDERKQLLEACRESSHPWLYTIVVLCLSTGARKMEVLGLTWRQVDFQRNVIVLEETKNGERRLLPLAAHALELMKELSKVRRIDTDLIFPGKDPTKPIEIAKAWERALDKAKIEDFRFHDLRHSAASYLAMNGASLAEIAEVLGHKTFQMVKRYSHLSEAHTAKVVERMNQKIFG